MTTRTPNLRGLIALAKRDGVDIRPTLVRVITDLFVQEPVHSPAEVTRYVELTRHMLEGVDETARFAVAMKLARYPAAPREILMMLATDAIEIAELVLSRAHFAEADLLRLADTLDGERRRILAERTDLPAAVAARLGVTRPAAQTPAAPKPAAPAESAREAAAGLLRPATAAGIVIKDIVAKDMATKDTATKPASLKAGSSQDAAAAPAASAWDKPLDLKPLKPATVKPIAESMASLMAKPAIPVPAPAAPLSTAPLSASAGSAAGGAASAGSVSAGSVSAGSVSAGSALAIADLEQAALQRKPEEFIDRLARIFDLDRAKAEEVVRDPTGQPVAIACRALDMPCDVFSRIVLFLDPTIGRSVALVFSLAEYYGRMSVAEANEVVATWRGPKRAAAPRHQPVTAPDGIGRHSFEPRRAAPPLPGAGRIAARG